MAPPKPRPATTSAPHADSPEPARRSGAASFEDAVIERVAQFMRRATGVAPAGEIWIGDDAAVVAPPAGALVLATDAVVAGVHADLSLGSLEDFGWKALAVALSDLGAMGAVPGHALVTIAAPPGTDVDLFSSGLGAAAATWSCPVVGGDLTTASQLVVSVAVSGTLVGDAPPVTRSGAVAGDALFVTGPLGASAAGLRLLRQGCPGGVGTRPAADRRLVERHLRPRPRLLEGQTARTAAATAMIDVSDGLALDLHRLADASRVGFAIGPPPVAPGATPQEALSGGEDYELLIATAEPDRLLKAFAAAGLDPPLTLGRCTAPPEDRRCEGLPLGRLGWEHRFA